jgi:hypothetical protein
MRQVVPYSLWLGNVRDARDLRSVYDAEIAALIDLAANELPGVNSRDLVYCRFPLVDGAGNAPWLLRSAIETTARFLDMRIPTLVYCGAGMSRSPIIAAGALAVFTKQPLDRCLTEVVASGSRDISPGLWQDVTHVVSDLLAHQKRDPA